MTGKSTLCCFDPNFLDFVVNVLEETSKNERTEDNFQESFHDTESEEEASDEKRSDYNNNNDNNGEDATLVRKISCSRRRALRKISALEFTILFHIFADQLQRKNWEKKIVHKRLGIIICRSHVARSSSENERKNCVSTEKTYCESKPYLVKETSVI
jgi:hypothetical protein